MSKTLELREIVTTELNKSNGESYYEIASDKAAYPYKVFTFDSIDLGDMSRDDLILVVDVWSNDVKEADQVADTLENNLNGNNTPSGTSYPTFFKTSRTTVPDEDKSIKHRQLKFLIQNYYTGA